MKTYFEKPFQHVKTSVLSKDSYMEKALKRQRESIFKGEYEPKELGSLFTKITTDLKSLILEKLIEDRDREIRIQQEEEEERILGSNSGLEGFKKVASMKNSMRVGDKSTQMKMMKILSSTGKSGGKGQMGYLDQMFSKDEEKFTIGTDDAILMKLEKFCRDFLQVLIKKYTLSLKFKTMSEDEINQNRVRVFQDLAVSHLKDLEAHKQPIDELSNEDMEDTPRMNKEKQKELKDLLAELEEKNIQIKKQQDKIEQLNKQVDSQRFDFLKELTRLREFVFQKETKTNFAEFIDARFFEPAKDLDEKTQRILDDQISHLTFVFNTRLYTMKQSNEKYFYQISTFEKLCQEGNQFITLKEMNALNIIKKLYIVEKQAKPVWYALEQCYGQGFFNKIIEDQFGITPDFQEKTAKFVTDELNQLKHDADQKIQKLASVAQAEIMKMARELKDKNQVLSQRRQAQIQEIDMIKDQLKFSIQRDNKKFVEELELKYQDQISQLNKKIYLLENGYKLGGVREKEEWKKFYDDEIAGLRKQNIDLMKVDQENKYLVQKFSIENKQLKHQFEEINMELEQIQNDILNKTKQANFIETECIELKKQIQQKQWYVELMEKEVEKVNIQIKRAQTQYPDAFVSFHNPMQTMEKMKSKVENELMNGLGKGLTQILHESKREKYVLTDIYDITVPLEFKISDEVLLDAPKNDIQVQTYIDREEKDMQTEIEEEKKQIDLKYDQEMQTDEYYDALDVLNEKEKKIEELIKQVERLDAQVREKKVSPTRRMSQMLHKMLSETRAAKSKEMTSSLRHNMSEEEIMVEDQKSKAYSKKQSVQSKQSPPKQLKQEPSKEQTIHTLYQDDSVAEIPNEEVESYQNNESQTDLSKLDNQEEVFNLQLGNDPKQNEKSHNFIKKKYKKKKKESKTQKQVQVYRIIPYNIPYLEKLLDKKQGNFKVDQNTQTDLLANYLREKDFYNLFQEFFEQKERMELLNFSQSHSRQRSSRQQREKKRNKSAHRQAKNKSQCDVIAKDLGNKLSNSQDRKLYEVKEPTGRFNQSALNFHLRTLDNTLDRRTEGSYQSVINKFRSVYENQERSKENLMTDEMSMEEYKHNTMLPKSFININTSSGQSKAYVQYYNTIKGRCTSQKNSDQQVNKHNKKEQKQFHNINLNGLQFPQKQNIGIRQTLEDGKNNQINMRQMQSEAMTPYQENNNQFFNERRKVFSRMSKGSYGNSVNDDQSYQQFNIMFKDPSRGPESMNITNQSYRNETKSIKSQDQSIFKGRKIQKNKH